MTVIEGLPPVGPPVSIETAANTDLLNGVNWQEQGVSFTPRGCLPAHLADAACVPCQDIEDPRFCADTKPDAVSFKPFWVYSAVNSCAADGRQAEYLEEVRQDLAIRRSGQIARALHQGVSGNPSLQSAATDLSGATASSPSEAIAAILNQVGNAGLNGGVFIGPAYTVPTLLQNDLIALTGGTYTTTLGAPYISDVGLPTDGPGGTPAPAGTAWIYWTPSRPVIAIDNRIDPPGAWDSTAFFDHTTGCYTPMARQRAIAVFNPCNVYSVLMDVRDCSPCASVPTPIIEVP